MLQRTPVIGNSRDGNFEVICKCIRRKCQRRTIFRDRFHHKISVRFQIRVIFEKKTVSSNGLESQCPTRSGHGWMTVMETRDRHKRSKFHEPIKMLEYCVNCRECNPHNLTMMLRRVLVMLTFARHLTKAMVFRRRISNELLSAFQQRVADCNKDAKRGVFVPFLVSGKVVGEARVDTARELAKFPNAFEMKEGTLTLSSTLETASPAERTSVVAEVTSSMRDSGLLTGWRNEMVTVNAEFGQPPMFMIERAAFPWLGTSGYGVFLNGFVEAPDSPGGVKLWVGTRSRSKQTYPGLRDSVVAGGITEGRGPSETMSRECMEEAGIPAELASRAAPTGLLCYRGVDDAGRLKRDVLFCFDLALPPDFTPTPVDGEVEGFELMDLDRVCRVLDGTEPGPGFKPNVALVTIDFLVRRGFIRPDAPGYLPLVHSLRGFAFE